MGTYRAFRDLLRRSDVDFARYENDFLTFTAGDWTVTSVGIGTRALSTTEPAGVLVVTNSAADNDSSFLQSTTEPWGYVAGKKLYVKARFKLLDALESDFVLGLQITDTTPLAVSDGIFIRKNDGSVGLDLVAAKNATETVGAGLYNLVNDTYVVAEIYYDGTDAISLYVDETRVGSIAVTNAPDDELLALSFGIQNGAAVANVLSVDYITVIQER